MIDVQVSKARVSDRFAKSPPGIAPAAGAWTPRAPRVAESARRRRRCREPGLRSFAHKLHLFADRQDGGVGDPDFPRPRCSNPEVVASFTRPYLEHVAGVAAFFRKSTCRAGINGGEAFVSPDPTRRTMPTVLCNAVQLHIRKYTTPTLRSVGTVWTLFLSSVSSNAGHAS
jgi:hypothetical protein